MSENQRKKVAGDAAERSVTHHLDRAYANDPTVEVLHDVRFGEGHSSTQIDHLVITRYGIILVETKSVANAVRIRKDGEWAWLYDGRWKVGQSPVAQVESQKKNLRELLRDNDSRILGKFIGFLQKRFGLYQTDCLVAISGEGRVERPDDADMDGIVRAEFVPDAVRKLIRKQKRETSLFMEMWGSVEGGGFDIGKKDYASVVAFLKPYAAAHRIVPTRIEPAPVPTVETSRVEVDVAAISRPPMKYGFKLAPVRTSKPRIPTEDAAS